MEVTINYNGQAVAVEVTLEVYEFLDRADHKAENLSHEQRRHWDGREFDEYIVATEGVGIYGETPEEYLCRMETLGELMAVQGIEQEPAALGLGAGVQDGHQLAQRFHAAQVFLRRFAVDTHALGSNYVFVKLPAIPMPPLFMGQVLGLVVGPVKKFIDFQRDLHGHS